MRFARLLLVVAVVFVTACAPSAQRLDLHETCALELSAPAVVQQHWLNQSATWRLRQSALLELRGQKIALEGFMVLDLGAQRLQMVAMNEMGVVFFELIVTPEGQQLRRALPQLQQQRGLAEGIGTSLRRIYLKPQPQTSDPAQMRSTNLRLWRLLADGGLSFVFDCEGRLREVSQSSEAQVGRLSMRIIN